MNCYRCNTENETGAHFCRHCGADLWEVPVEKDDGSRKSLHYVLILMCWDYFTMLVWMVIPRLVVSQRFFETGYSRISSIYNIVGGVLGSISLLLLIIFAILVTNKTARILLIVFAAFRLLALMFTFVSMRH
jgi:hypothetical protein